MPHKFFGGAGIDILHPANSMDQVAMHFKKTTGVQLRHFILSFDPTEIRDPLLANLIATSLVDHFFEKYQVVYALHENTANLHAHFIVNAVSYVDGSKYRGTKSDYYCLLRNLRRILKWYGFRGLRYVTALTEDFDI